MHSQTQIKSTDTRNELLERLRYFNKRVTNRLTMRFAGKHVYAVIHHQGRKSGKSYQTPVVAMPYKDGFILPLPYGQHVDWCRNLLAADTCRLEWRGRMYSLRAPKLIEPQTALPAFPGWLRYLLRRTDIYLKMERASGPDLPPEQKTRNNQVLVAGVLLLLGFFAGWLIFQHIRKRA